MVIEMDDQKLKALEILIIAGGKSPSTDGSMMVMAVDMLRYLSAEVEKFKAGAASQEAETRPSNGKFVEHDAERLQ